MSDLKQLIRIVRATQKEGYLTRASGCQTQTEWLLQAASAVLALRCIPEQYGYDADTLIVTSYYNDAKPRQNLVVIALPEENEWVSIPLCIFNGHTGAALMRQAWHSGGAHPVAQYHETDCRKDRDDTNLTPLLTENDQKLWCMLWNLMNQIDASKIPQMLSFEEHGDLQKGALLERLFLMGKVSTYQEMADANLIP